MKLNIVGLDPSMSNLGIAKGIYDTETGQLKITECLTIVPMITSSKQVRQNSKDLERAKQLLKALHEHTRHAHLICAEIPVGSQSSRACVSYGISVALMAAVVHTSLPFIEVSPLEVKQVVGNKSASKLDVIQWVQNKHPEAPLETYCGALNASKAEHQADAIVAIHAAMQTLMFNSLKSLYTETKV